MIYRGRVESGRILLEDGVTLPEGTEVQVIATKPGEKRSLADRFRKFIGVVDDLPSDMAENHDHYLYGTPKK